MTKRQLAQQFPLTADELKTFNRAAQQVWSDIAYDVLESNDGKDLPRSHVIELVHDADRLKEAVKRATRKEGMPAGLAALFPDYGSRVSSDAVDLLLKDVFKYSRYGL